MKSCPLLLIILVSCYGKAMGQKTGDTGAGTEPSPVILNTVTAETIISTKQILTINRQQHYLSLKSKTQKISGLVLLTSGSVMGLIGIRSGWESIKGNQLPNAGFTTPGNEVNNGGKLALTGLVMMAGSIPYFISSLKNKNKAGLKFTCQKTSIGSGNRGSKKVTGLTYAIPIGKH